MARYIDIESVGIGKAKREVFLVPEYADGWNNAIEIFENTPTADVEEVIRCKDCQHWNPIGFAENGGWCEKKDIAALHNGFCESGEGKSDE